jgi:hypothetical protein
VTCTAHAVTPEHALAQTVSGAMTASATILPPITTPAVKPLSFRVERDGTARLETTTPFAGAVSAIVMSTVASSANGFTPIPQRPALVSATPDSELLDSSPESTVAATSRWRYEVPLDASPDRATPHDVTVHITYLIVPGT